jgi:pyruvate/2-oxoacid:ferredoxin oxidoreductase alpha subunit
MQRTTSGTAGNGLYTKIEHMHGAAGICLGTMIMDLRRTTGAAANKNLGTTIKYI